MIPGKSNYSYLVDKYSSRKTKIVNSSVNYSAIDLVNKMGKLHSLIRIADNKKDSNQNFNKKGRKGHGYMHSSTARSGSKRHNSKGRKGLLSL